MKKPILLFTIAAMLSAFTPPSGVSEKTRIHSSKKLGLEIIRAAANHSEAEFLALLPTISDFHGIMNANAGVYRQNIAEAQKEFSSVYASRVVPQAKKAFSDLLRQAEERKIDWRTIEVTGIDTGNEPDATLSFVTVTVHFLSKDKPYEMVIDKSLVWNGQWKVSQYIRLVEG